MRLRIRSKADGLVRVYDQEGNEIAGVLSVDIHAEPGKPALTTIRCVADVTVDAEDVDAKATHPLMDVDADNEKKKKLGAIIADEMRKRK